ncbi:response regulator [Streptomyces sp. NPDC056401]|uniref:response regulator n=1 Tax=Streptomyces sp. NPDC056401 TaxID=3345809 RepID=UPI0035E371D8
MIRVLLADDEEMVRRGLRTILEAGGGFTVVAEAADGRAAVAQAAWSNPDIALVDIRMPVRDGLGATEDLLALPRPPRVVVLTAFDADDHVRQALRRGACGFLLKDTPPREILAALRAVADGHAALSPPVTSRVIEDYRAGAARSAGPSSALQAELDGLSKRERDVLALIAEGATNSEIAGRLFLGESTVKAHVSRVLAKLGVGNRVRAALLAQGLVPPPER